MFNEFFFGATWDALVLSAKQIDAVNARYQTLRGEVDDFMVVNQISSNRKTEEGEVKKKQRINISTNFGHGNETGVDLSTKYFHFDEGARLFYFNIVSSKNGNEFEVMNYQSVVNLINSLTSASTSGTYIPVENDNVVSGEYRFANKQTFWKASFTTATLSQDLDSALFEHTDFEKSVVNAKSIARYVRSKTDALTTNGVFLSKNGDEADGDYLFRGNVHIDGSLNVEGSSVITQANWQDQIFVSDDLTVPEILSEDGIWRAEVSQHPRGKPLDYCLYLKEDEYSASFPLSQSQLPYWAYIDENGALMLGVNTTTVNVLVPWSGETIGDAESLEGAIVYLSVRKWGDGDE